MNKIIIALISLALIATPAFASSPHWSVKIGADVSGGATAIVAGAGGTIIPPGDPTPGFSYAVDASGGIVNGDGNIDLNGGGSNDGGGMGVEISGSGASGDLIFATHDLAVNGCCTGEGCPPCPAGYVYDASSAVTITGGSNVNLEIGGGAGSDGAGQHLEVGEHHNSIDAGSVDAHMSSSLTTDSGTETHLMGAYGQNVWFFAKGHQGFSAEECNVNGFFISVMGYGEPSHPR